MLQSSSWAVLGAMFSFGATARPSGLGIQACTPPVVIWQMLGWHKLPQRARDRKARPQHLVSSTWFHVYFEILSRSFVTLD